MTDRKDGLLKADKLLKESMDYIMRSQNLIDICRRLNILRADNTFEYKGDNESRIDTFGGSQSGTNKYIKAGIIEFKISDHTLIFIKIGKNKRNRWGGGNGN
jgi:hypothetical protein